jgi:capsular polysaccharide biosynthesis protein
MKTLMDRLMARQRHLLQRMDEPPKAPRLTAEERSKRRAEEQSALEAALEALATGNIVSAAALLEPHAERAQEPRTLTTLSRIRSAAGHFDEALELLQRAEKLDPADTKVAFFLAELLQSMGRHHEAIAYRRRVAFTSRDATAAAFLGLISAIVKASAGKPTLASELKVALGALHAAPDVTPRQLAEAARLAYTIDGQAADAVALHTSADPCPEGSEEVTVRWTTLPAWCSHTGRAAQRLGEEGEPGRRPSAIELADVTVHPGLGWVPIVGSPPAAVFSGLVADRLRLRNEDPASPMLMTSASTAVLRLPRDLQRIEQPALLLGGSGDYFRDTIEFVGALAITERLGLDRKLPLVVNQGCAAHMTELLDLLGYGALPLVQLGPETAARFEKLVVTTRLVAGSRWFDPMLAPWYRRRLVEPLGSLPPPNRKLYLSRAGVTRRRLSNEAAVVAALVPLGYEVVQPETMPLREQIALFAQAREIVGASGDAFTNVIYAPPGARVVVLQNKLLGHHGGGVSFSALAASCGHRSDTLECAPTRLASGERPADADLMADVDALLSCLR